MFFAGEFAAYSVPLCILTFTVLLNSYSEGHTLLQQSDPLTSAFPRQ
jgi:hypothetical protein